MKKVVSYTVWADDLQDKTIFYISGIDSEYHTVYKILIIIKNNEISYKFYYNRKCYIVSWQNLKTILHMNYKTPMELINSFDQMFDLSDNDSYGVFINKLKEILNAQDKSRY